MILDDEWPSLALAEWLPTYATLHRWVQIVGKTRLVLAPFENHWWHCALYVSARGLTTSAMPFGGGDVEIEFDFLSDELALRTGGGEHRTLALESKSVAAFYDEYTTMLRSVGVDVQLHPAPNEVVDATPFPDDRAHATYDASAARRWWGALRHAHHALAQFRSGFAGKCSPAHFWWGGFDIACTRFSGNRAPRHPGGVPNCPPFVMDEAYSHECISAGWWPGTLDSPIAEPAFYAYAYPEPPGCSDVRIDPPEARYDSTMREWILPYGAVRASSDPHRLIAAFLESTYAAAASLGKWNVDALRASGRARELERMDGSTRA
jgi:hypothetical protein